MVYDMPDWLFGFFCAILGFIIGVWTAVLVS